MPLVVLYDGRCPLCRRLRAWLGSQATLAPVEYVAADSAEAHARFPGLDHRRTTTVLTMVRADGAVYEGERAWLVAAWLLPSWRGVAEHLGTRRRQSVVRVAARVVDAVRVHLVEPDAPSRSSVAPYGAQCDRCRIVAPPPARALPPPVARIAARWPPPTGRPW